MTVTVTVTVTVNKKMKSHRAMQISSLLRTVFLLGRFHVALIMRIVFILIALRSKLAYGPR